MEKEAKIIEPTERAGTEAKAKNTQAMQNSVSGESLDKVRDILFGTQINNLEKKISLLNDNLFKEIDELRGETKRRFDSLESFVKKLDNESAQAQRDIRQKILDQSKALRQEIFQKSEDISAALLKAVQDIRDDMTDRRALAGMLERIVFQLGGEEKASDQES